MHAAGVPRAETLASGAFQRKHDRMVIHAVVAMSTRNVAGQPRADRAVGVADRIVEVTTLSQLHQRRRVLGNTRGQCGLVTHRIARQRAGKVAARAQADAIDQRCEVELVLNRRGARDLLQQLSATDNLTETAHAQLRQMRTHVLGDETEIVHHHFGQTSEVFLAQHRMLGCHAGCAVVEVADTQILAAQCDHRAGAETETLGTEQRGLDHVQTSLQATVGLQPHAAAQVVTAQRLLRFGDAEFPWRAGVLDRGERTGAGAAVVAAHRDQIRASLHHTGGDRANSSM